MELVSERKRKLDEKVVNAEFVDLSEAVSSHLSLDQNQLAAWDNSARAWLAAANDSPVVRSRQKAVRSLLNRVKGTVNMQTDVYTSVTETWTVALEILEKVIGGMSCSISDGAVILALISWHIYPDLIVLYPETHEIFQHDHLVQSSQITVGLSRPAFEHSNVINGVDWSLSLAHLRYYGNVGVTSRSLECTPSGGSRFTVNEFTLVLIGAFIGQWSESEDITLGSATDFILFAFSKIEEALLPLMKKDGVPKQGTWIRLILDSLAIVKIDNHEDRRRANTLLNLGWRSRKVVEHPVVKSHRLFASFGLASLNFCQALRQPDDQDAFVQDYIGRFMGYKPQNRSTAWKYACLIFMPLHRGSSAEEVILYPRDPRKIGSLGVTKCEEFRGVRSDGGHVFLFRVDRIRWLPPMAHAGPTIEWSQPPQPMLRIFAKTKQNYYVNHKSSFELAETGRTSFHAVLITSDLFGFRHLDIDNGLVRKYIGTKPLEPYGLVKLFESLPICRYLRFLAAVNHLYEELPGATINPTIVENPLPLWKASRVPYKSGIRRVLQHDYLHPEALRLMSMLQTGYDPGMLTDKSPVGGWGEVLAVSTGNTLYIHPALVGSPRLADSSSFRLRSVRGNIGMPGLTVSGWLTDTGRIEIKTVDTNRWEMINHDPFDGKLEDSLADTSLHLQLTGYSQPIDFGAHNRIPSGTIVDAVVSAHHRGQWIGDINILDALGYALFSHRPAKGRLRVVTRQLGCTTSTMVLPQRDLVTIQNWDELLSPHPSLPGVVKSYGNWQARSTAVSLCCQLGYDALLFDDHGCWDCAFKILDGVKKSSDEDISESHEDPDEEGQEEEDDDETLLSESNLDSDSEGSAREGKNSESPDISLRQRSDTVVTANEGYEQRYHSLERPIPAASSAISGDDDEYTDTASSSDETSSVSSHVKSNTSKRRPVVFIL
ncbi:hypothetical protein GGR57DRAFT_224829 [Xylariaceae sp. FL1272]|nr:hypothetical protein GGR57DRAFT_224829 [Xylariaceae sp. FL1272]